MAITLQESLRGIFYAPFYVALARDAYAREGVTVHFASALTPGRAAVGVLDGSADVCWGGPMRVMQAYEQVPACDLVHFAEVVTRDPFLLLGHTPKPDFALHDLFGLRVGTVSEVPTPWLCLQDDIRRDGADPGAVARVTDGTMAGNAAALRSGPLDAVQLFQPYAEELLASGAGHLWYAAAGRGLTAYTTLVTRRSVVEQKRDELLQMVRAMYQTLRWVRATPGAEIQPVLGGYFPEVPPAIYAAAVDRYRALGLYGPDPVTRREGFDRLAAAMRSGGALKRNVPFEECVDNTLAEQVVGEG